MHNVHASPSPAGQASVAIMKHRVEQLVANEEREDGATAKAVRQPPASTVARARRLPSAKKSKVPEIPFRLQATVTNFLL